MEDRGVNESSPADPDSKGQKFYQSGLFKTIGALGVVLPIIVSLVSAVFTYIESSREKMDENFREIVSMLTSEKSEQRLAAASSMGTFIQEGLLGQKGVYYDDATNILINRISSELDYRVLGAIRGSLEKVDEKEYISIIEKLLKVDRNIFIYEHPYKLWKGDIEKFKKAQSELYLKLTNTESNTNANKSVFTDKEKQNIEKIFDVNLKKERDVKNELENIKTHRLMVSNFIAYFLTVTRNMPVTKIKFYQNSLNYVRLSEVKLPGLMANLSTVSNAVIFDSDFSNSNIKDTFFSFSSIRTSSFRNSNIKRSLFDQAVLVNCDFSGAKFEDVYFYGSNLKDTDFTNVSGVDPHYFYGAFNLDKAIFDESVREELLESVKKISLQDYKVFIGKSSLQDDKYVALIEDINEKYKVK